MIILLPLLPPHPLFHFPCFPRFHHCCRRHHDCRCPCPCADTATTALHCCRRFCCHRRCHQFRCRCRCATAACHHRCAAAAAPTAALPLPPLRCHCRRHHCCRCRHCCSRRRRCAELLPLPPLPLPLPLLPPPLRCCCHFCHCCRCRRRHCCFSLFDCCVSMPEPRARIAHTAATKVQPKSVRAQLQPKSTRLQLKFSSLPKLSSIFMF